MTNIKVRDGTPDQTADLCRNCANGMRVNGEGYTRTICNALDQIVHIKGKVHDCTRFRQRTTEPNIYTMYDEAWYRVQLKDGRFTFCTQNGSRELQKRGLLFNEQEANIKELLKLYRLDVDQSGLINAATEEEKDDVFA